ncbi:MAG: kynureninase [Acidobacteriota bacterium]
MKFEVTDSFAERMDSDDSLRRFRQNFLFPQRDGRDLLYFTGNSLGLQPNTAATYVTEVLDDWKALGVEGHISGKHPWLPYHEFVADNLAKIVGASPLEVVAMNSLTVNLHLMMVSFYRPTRERFKVIIESGAFPSDRYAVESQIRFHGYEPERALIEIKPREGEDCLRTEDIEREIGITGNQLALVMLGGVNYRTGQLFDMQRIAAAAQKAGAFVGFDLAHAAGNVPLKLHDWNADFAVWCSYKYLNSGPGAIAGAFIHERHADDDSIPRFAGWWGHEKETRFLMGPEFKPLRGAEGWQLSNPPIFQLAALRASLELFAEAGMEDLRKKSVQLTGYLEFLVNAIGDDRIELVTPSSADERGCQLSIRVRHADKSLYNNLLTRGISVDWREPDIVRCAPVPLYNSFSDVLSFTKALKECIDLK